MSGLLETSAVALLDALGFRDIQAHPDVEAATDALESVRDTMTFLSELMREPFIGGRSVRLSKSWFSDTLCLVAQTAEGQGDDPVHLLESLLFAVGQVLKEATGTLYSLAFRGVITLGQAHVHKEDIFFGPAIVEAAALYEKAEGAFVWLAPSAAKLLSAQPGRLITHRVPLKSGQSIETFVVNPYWDDTEEIITAVREAMDERLRGDRIDIAIKRQNTSDFLKVAEKRVHEAIYQAARSSGSDPPP